MSDTPSRTGYMFAELFLWHNPGDVQDISKGLEPTQHFEHVDTKRRLNNIVHVSGLHDKMTPIKARPATQEELCRVHTKGYVEFVQATSKDKSKVAHKIGDEVSMSPGGYEIAALAAGGSIALVDAALDGTISNGYGLTRPPGHHATASEGMGFCVFNNIAVAAAHALEARGLSRIAIVDCDVHHGNGTQSIFYEDPRVLFISLHQDSNYPIGSGPITDTGAGAGLGTTINIPLPPGSGGGAYRAAFDRVVTPALDAFEPQLILVSAGYDASYMDPLAAQMCSSEDYRYFTKVMAAAAARCPACRGLLFFHEGGYSAELTGVRTFVKDPVLASCEAWGYQGLQAWQEAVIEQVVAGPLALLKQRLVGGDKAAAPVEAAEAAAAT